MSLIVIPPTAKTGSRIYADHLFPAIVSAVLGLTICRAEVPEPKIERGRFDSNGKLVVTVSSLPPVGCSLALWGGLVSGSVDTLITTKKITEANSTLATISVRTRRKYYCKRRTLNVRIISECYPEATPSEPLRVSVPASNIQK
jgi:hypothetical protein